MVDLREMLHAQVPDSGPAPLEAILTEAARRRRRRRRRARFGALGFVSLAAIGAFVSLRPDDAVIRATTDTSTSVPQTATAPIVRVSRVAGGGVTVELEVTKDSEVTAAVRTRLDQATRDENGQGRPGVPSECYPADAIRVRAFDQTLIADWSSYSVGRVRRTDFFPWLVSGKRLDDHTTLTVVALQVVDPAYQHFSLRMRGAQVDAAVPTNGWVVLAFLDRADEIVTPVPAFSAQIVGVTASGTETVVDLPFPPVEAGRWC